MEFLNSLKQVQTNAKHYPAWQQQEAQTEARHEQWLKEHPPNQEELAEAKQYARTMVEAINTMDTYAINKSEDVMAVTQSGAVLTAGIIATLLITSSAALVYLTKMGRKASSWCGNQAVKLTEKFVKSPELLTELKAISSENKFNLGYGLITVGIGFIAEMGIAIADAILVRGAEKETARVARFQAREIALNDPRNFTLYTSEQVKAAKEYAEEHPVKPEKKKSNTLNPFSLFGNSLKTTMDIAGDHEKYQKWKAHYTKAKNHTQVNPSKISAEEQATA